MSIRSDDEKPLVPLVLVLHKSHGVPPCVLDVRQTHAVFEGRRTSFHTWKLPLTPQGVN